jgi:uncharacterized protein (PEP-CTERM system associated)
MMPVRATNARWMRAIALGPMTLVAAAAHAQVWTHEASVQTQALVTDNSRPGTAQGRTADLVMAVRPGLRLSAVGSSLRLALDAGVGLVDSARGTVDGSVQPRVDASVSATLVPRLLTVEGSAGVHQVEADPFGSRVVDVSTANRRTAADYRLAPTLRWEFAPRFEAFARHEESLHTNASLSAVAGQAPRAADLRGHHTTLRLERQPVPLGLAMELARDDSRTEGEGVDQQVRLDTVRAQLSYAIVDADLVVGVVAGHERGTVSNVDVSDTVRGLTLHWAPSARTDVTGRIERRFFGTGGELSIGFRTSRSSLSLRAHRGPSTTSSAIGAATRASDFGTQAAAVVAARSQQANAVSGLAATQAAEEALGRRGMTIALPQVMDLATGYPQLESGVNARLLLLGVRHIVSLDAHIRTLRRLPGVEAATSIAADGDSRQIGGAASLTRRLTATRSADVTLSASRVQGLAARAGDRTDEGDVRVSLIDQLAPRTTLATTLRYGRLRTNVAGLASSETTSLLLSLNHRF